MCVSACHCLFGDGELFLLLRSWQSNTTLLNSKRLIKTACLLEWGCLVSLLTSGPAQFKSSTRTQRRICKVYDCFLASSLSLRSESFQSWQFYITLSFDFCFSCIIETSEVLQAFLYLSYTPVQDLKPSSTCQELINHSEGKISVCLSVITFLPITCPFITSAILQILHSNHISPFVQLFCHSQWESSAKS